MFSFETDGDMDCCFFLLPCCPRFCFGSRKSISPLVVTSCSTLLYFLFYVKLSCDGIHFLDLLHIFSCSVTIVFTFYHFENLKVTICDCLIVVCSLNSVDKYDTLSSLPLVHTVYYVMVNSVYSDLGGLKSRRFSKLVLEDNLLWHNYSVFCLLFLLQYSLSHCSLITSICPSLDTIMITINVDSIEFWQHNIFWSLIVLCSLNSVDQFPMQETFAWYTSQNITLSFCLHLLRGFAFLLWQSNAGSICLIYMPK